MRDIRFPQLTLQRDEASADFFDAVSAGAIIVLDCGCCGGHRSAASPVCSACGATEATARRACGRGSLVSWTVVERAPHPAFAEVVPYVVGIVELDEGPWLHARLLVAADQVWPGMALRAQFHRSPDGEAYPVFTAED
jgi:uncharacterized OB-fold protein